MSDYHVAGNRRNGWDVKQERAQKSSIHTNTQFEAERIAKRFAANSGGGEVVIHGQDGRIRDSDTIPPAHDPFPPRDKKH